MWLGKNLWQLGGSRVAVVMKTAQFVTMQGEEMRIWSLLHTGARPQTNQQTERNRYNTQIHNL